ncbi:MAG TPA: sigma-54-dependent Fis family transcriptional regulator [Porticoccaceae bacterium]|nr:sigma-54-dependent Fis family transcriptional regulator [Porticoccaceae bacterium]HCO59987.1 sigma-54-dependent Fis family transcriptional regulator [Porticoccaceae bacterium]
MSEQVVLVVEDDDLLREALSDTLQLAGYRVAEAENGATALVQLQNSSIDLVISDVQMAVMDGHVLLQNIKRQWPHLPVVLMTAYGTIAKAVEAIRDGAADYLVKPFEAAVLVETVSRLMGEREVDSAQVIGEDPRAKEVLALARRVADSEVTVMLTGESGSGKEVLARLIHDCSPRKDGPFVAINCAALPEAMLESILFGYEKGAFTGAHQSRAGKFEQAQGGTILLDEISEMDISLQAKLLRVLQEKEVERLGGKNAISLDVRVLATSNRDLKEQVLAGSFREDLYYRLNVFPLKALPLRERPLDILPLARSFAAGQSGQRRRVSFAEAAERRLLQHSWPGNIRELHNVIQRAVILCHGDCVQAEDISLEDGFFAPREDGGDIRDCAVHEDDESVLESGLKNREQQLIIEALQAENGRRKQAAERLGISPRTLRYKLAKLREEGVALPGAAGF